MSSPIAVPAAYAAYINDIRERFEGRAGAQDGKGGRVTKGDVLERLEHPAPAAPAPPRESVPRELARPESKSDGR